MGRRALLQLQLQLGLGLGLGLGLSSAMVLQGGQPAPPLPGMSLSSASAASSLGSRVRADFPLILSGRTDEGRPITYLDSAATSHKPRAVLEALQDYYSHRNSNVHRGAHTLSVRSTEAYEAARDKIKAFVNARDRREIVFTRGATEAINLVANTWGDVNIQAGDEIVLTVMEHHSNLVPWQMLARRKGAVLRFAKLTPGQTLDMDHFRSLLGPRTKLVSFVHASNTLGCVNPVKQIVEEAHRVGAAVLLDACQSVPNMPVDVRDLGVDFLVASGHKMCGPTGIGFLYGRLNMLEDMPPWQGGGEMIDVVTYDAVTFAPPPSRFEAGTPAIAQAVGLGAACDYLTSVGMENVAAHEHTLAKYLWQRLSEFDDLQLYGPPPNESGDNRTPLVAFNSKSVHASDLSFFMDQEGVAVRAGHHCTQPLHGLFGAAGSLRASCYLYNTLEDIDILVEAMTSSLEFLQEAPLDGLDLNLFGEI
jgi:cysteine desulfurase/selenocysteine lyase